MTASVRKTLAIKASALLVAAMFTATTLITAPMSASASVSESGASAYNCAWRTFYQYSNGVWARVVNGSLHQGVYFNNPPSSYVIENASGASSWMNGSRLEVGYSWAMLRAGYTPWGIRLRYSAYTCYA